MRPIATEGEIRWFRLSRRRTELALVEIFDFCRRHEIEPILIKGWAAARNYPPNEPRFFGDIDLAVSVGQFAAAESIIFSPEAPAVGVDLHRGLRHLDTVDFETLFSRSLLFDLDGTMIRILRPEDHLRVLCVHWLTDGGAYKDRLWDVYYAVANRPDDFDWDLCLKSVSETRQKWIVTTIRLAEK
ncbi:MAG: nucleotidyltransferase family protein, partial [Alphaproteobacteria bacterium]